MKSSVSVLRAIYWVLAGIGGMSLDSRAQDPVAKPFVSIEATSPRTSEPLPAALVLPGEITVRRRDSLDAPLTVYLTYGGTASSADYEPVPSQLVIPAGKTEEKFFILAKADDLIEGTETVGVKLLEAPTSPDSISYEISPFAPSAEVAIADEDQPNGLPTVGIKIVRAETIEPSPLSRVAPAELIVYREGSTRAELDVFIEVEGSATPDVDYGALDKVVHFPSGESEVKLTIAAHDDAVAEGDETVLVRLTIPPTDGLPKYAIGTASEEKVVIHDNNLNPRAVIKISHPDNGAELPVGLDVEIAAVAVDPGGYIPTLEFYLDDTLLDTSVITFIQAPEPGSPIHHSINWKSPAAGKHELVARGKDARGVIVSSEPVLVIVGAATEDTLVSLWATDIEGTELPASFSSIQPLEFQVSRTGPTNGSLLVFFSLHGTATKADYFAVPTSVVIPAGSDSAKFQVIPTSDLLAVVEPMETVGVRLDPSPMAGPFRTYGINPTLSTAGGVIYEQRPPDNAVELVFPVRGEGHELGQPIELLAALYGSGTAVEFYDREEKIGSHEVAIDAAGDRYLTMHPFSWKGVSLGEHIVTARATLADGKQITSERFLVVVKGSEASPAHIRMTEPADGQNFAAGDSITIGAVAIDPEGYIARLEFFANERYIGVSQIAFFRAPDPGTPITHSFLWENVPAGEYALTARGIDSRGQTVASFPVKITVGRGIPEDRVVLIVESVDQFADESTGDTAKFLIRRIAGPKNVAVPVNFSLSGTAVNGIDYTEVKESAVLPADTESMEVVIAPISDKAIEGDEIIMISLKEPACVKIFPAPPECYLIGKLATARTILRDEGSDPIPTEAKIELISPIAGESLETGTDIKLASVAVDPKGYISRVEFYANDSLIGVSDIVFIRAPDPGTSIFHTAIWERVPAGEYVLTARAIDSQGKAISSQRVRIVVGADGGGGGGGDQVVIVVESADSFAAETTDSGVSDKGSFIIRRVAGPKDIEVPVFFKIGGTADNGVDYAEVKEQVTIPAGAETVEVIIEPIPDKALELDEIVELALVSPICPAIFPAPPQCYRIGRSSGAKIVIRDHSTGADDLIKVAIVPSSEGAKAPGPQPLEIRADAAVKGKSCVLETTIDLKVWTPVAPVVLPDGQLTYVTETGAENQRYYRLRVQ